MNNQFRLIVSFLSLLFTQHILSAQCIPNTPLNVTQANVQSLSQEWTNFSCANNSYNIPIHLTILRGSDGMGTPTELINYPVIPQWGSVRQILPLVNAYFNGRFNFYISSTHILANNNWLTVLWLPGNEDIDMFNEHHVNNAINLYLVNQANDTNGTYKAYAKSPESWLPNCPNIAAAEWL
jgi:hypothetical protein